MNPTEKALTSDRIDNSDVKLYLLQHMNKLEQYLKAQEGGESLNALHYADLQERLQLIRERSKSPNR